MDKLRVLNRVSDELDNATAKFGPFHNAHEGYAVLLEEVDELWEAVKLNQNRPERDERIRDEAIQVAAMAIRLIIDCAPVAPAPNAPKPPAEAHPVTRNSPGEKGDGKAGGDLVFDKDEIEELKKIGEIGRACKQRKRVYEFYTTHANGAAPAPNAPKPPAEAHPVTRNSPGEKGDGKAGGDHIPIIDRDFSETTEIVDPLVGRLYTKDGWDEKRRRVLGVKLPGVSTPKDDDA